MSTGTRAPTVDSGTHPLFVLSSFQDVFRHPRVAAPPQDTLAAAEEATGERADEGTPTDSWVSETPPLEPFEGDAATGEDIHFTLRGDICELFPMLGRDALSLITWQNTMILGFAAFAAVDIRQDLDGRVREETAEHPMRWGKGSQTLRLFGEAQLQVPIMFSVYGYSLWTQDEYLHDFTKSMISAHALSSIATVIIKGIADTKRPDPDYLGGHYGFPSYHTSSSFAIAASIESYYGWKLGLPAYALAGLVGWSRIDQREHDLSDVLFGAVLGCVIGKSVAATHQECDGWFRVHPYYEPSNRASGVTLEVPY